MVEKIIDNPTFPSGRGDSLGTLSVSWRLSVVRRSPRVSKSVVALP